MLFWERRGTKTPVNHTFQSRCSSYPEGYKEGLNGVVALTMAVKFFQFWWLMVKIEHRKAPSTHIPIFFNPQLFLCGFGFPATTLIGWIWKTNPQLFESALQEWKFFNTVWIRNRVDAKSGYFCIRPWRNKIKPSSLHWILYSRWQLRSQVLSLTRLYDACSVANRVNPAYVSDTWKSKFDLNTDTCGRRNFWIRKEKVVNSKNIRIRVEGT